MRTKQLIAIAIAAGIAYFIFTERKELDARNAALPGVAASLGLNYIETQQSPSDLVQTAFPLLSKGTSPAASNAMTGNVDGAYFSVFDFSYMRYSAAQDKQGTEPMQQVDQSVAFVNASNLSLPAFTLRPLNIVEKAIQTATGEAEARFGDKIDDRVRDALADIQRFSGLQSIEFPSHPQFTDKYLLTANDETAVRAVFTPAVLDRLLQMNPVALEAQGSEFLYYRPSVLSSEDEIGQLMTEAREMLGVLSAG